MLAIWYDWPPMSFLLLQHLLHYALHLTSGVNCGVNHTIQQCWRVVRRCNLWITENCFLWIRIQPTKSDVNESLPTATKDQRKAPSESWLLKKITFLLRACLLFINLILTGLQQEFVGRNKIVFSQTWRTSLVSGVYFHNPLASSQRIGVC